MSGLPQSSAAWQGTETLDERIAGLERALKANRRLVRGADAERKAHIVATRAAIEGELRSLKAIQAEGKARRFLAFWRKGR